MNYWLMKSEPDVYSIDDLEKQDVTPWEGIRNYQARNFMRDDMKVGDRMLFYHSNSKPPGIAGTGVVCKESYPDYFAWDPSSKYFDAKSTKDNPRWMMVDIKFEQKFSTYISLEEMKSMPELEGILVTKRGMRLSIQPISEQHFQFLVKIGVA
jgi:predicted RNA-binding protein with PUA-like domain